MTAGLLRETGNNVITEGFALVARYQQFAARGVEGAESGLSQSVFTLPFPWQIFGRVGYAIITPVPVPSPLIEWNWIGLGTVVQILFFPFLLLGVRAVWRRPEFAPLLVALLVLAGGYTFGTLGFRHFSTIFPLAAIVGTVGYMQNRAYRSVAFVSGLALLCALGLLYWTIKR